MALHCLAIDEVMLVGINDDKSPFMGSDVVPHHDTFPASIALSAAHQNCQDESRTRQ